MTIKINQNYSVLKAFVEHRTCSGWCRLKINIQKLLVKEEAKMALKDAA